MRCNENENNTLAGVYYSYSLNFASVQQFACTLRDICTPVTDNNSITYAVSGGITGGLTGGVTSYALTGDFWSGAKVGAISRGIMGGVMGGISGYRSAVEQGRNPWTGGVTKQLRNELKAMGIVSKIENVQSSMIKMYPNEYSAAGEPVAYLDENLKEHAVTYPDYDVTVTPNGIKSEIAFGKSAIKNPIRFYLVSKHELVHAFDIYTGCYFQGYHAVIGSIANDYALDWMTFQGEVRANNVQKISNINLNSNFSSPSYRAWRYQIFSNSALRGRYY